jgi:hypothetical protein
MSVAIGIASSVTLSVLLLHTVLVAVLPKLQRVVAVLMSTHGTVIAERCTYMCYCLKTCSEHCAPLLPTVHSLT